MKDIARGFPRQVMDCKKIFAKDITDKKWFFKLCKELLKLNNEFEKLKIKKIFIKKIQRLNATSQKRYTE